jgi:hypothetical protein
MKLSAVILTMGDRPKEAAAAVRSVRDQSLCEAEVVVVGNGAPPGVAGDLTEALPENLGIPEGRNVGAGMATGDVILFLDDDATLAGEDACGRLLDQFESDPDLAVVSMRIVDPATGITQRRHVPRLGRGDPLEGGAVTTFLGGACAVRRVVFASLGGFPGEFFYAHEETDFAWRAINAGWSVRYQPEVVVTHPPTTTVRHADADRISMRNRVLLARRNLPLPLVPIYPVSWLVLSLARSRSIRRWRAIFRGFAGGWREEAERSPIRWSTVWALTRLGRPPIV